MQEFGRLVLNKNPENYHRDVEQAAFSPGSMVPGVEDSPDPLLQFRMFFYRDAQYHRIGVNLHQVPVNCPFMTQRDPAGLPVQFIIADSRATGLIHPSISTARCA